MKSREINPADNAGDSNATWLVRIPRSLFLLALLLIEIIKVGVWWKPDLSFKLAYSQNPLVNPWPESPLSQSHMWTWLSPAIGHVTGATTPTSYLLLHLLFLVAFIAILVTTIFKRMPEGPARFAVLGFACLPITPTLFIWLGDDALTALLILLAIINPRARALSIAAAVLLGMQHFEVGVGATAILAIAYTVGHFAREPRFVTTGHIVRMGAGIIIGRLLLIGIFEFASVQVTGGRQTWLETYFSDLLQQYFSSWQFILYSLLGVTWLLFFISWRFRELASPTSVGAAVLAAFLLTSFVFDQTRIASLALLPVMLTYWTLNSAFLAAVHQRFFVFLALLYVITPIIWVWQGEVQPGAFPALLDFFNQDGGIEPSDWVDAEVSLRPFRL